MGLRDLAPESKLSNPRLSAMDEAVEYVLERMDRSPSSMECVGGGVLLCTFSVNLNLWILIPNSVYSGSAMMLF